MESKKASTCDYCTNYRAINNAYSRSCNIVISDQDNSLCLENGNCKNYRILGNPRHIPESTLEQSSQRNKPTEVYSFESENDVHLDNDSLSDSAVIEYFASQNDLPFDEFSDSEDFVHSSTIVNDSTAEAYCFSVERAPTLSVAQTKSAMGKKTSKIVNSWKAKIKEQNSEVTSDKTLNIFPISHGNAGVLSADDIIESSII